MKRVLSFALALMMVFSLSACGGKGKDNNNDKKETPEVTMTAQEILDSLKKSLGDSYTSDSAETEDRMSGYYGLDMSKIENWAAESNSSSSLNMDCAVVLQVKDGYAQDAAALLQDSFEQVCSYARMYNMDLQRVLEAHLYVNGNYVALLIEGQKGDLQASEEDQAKFAADEAAKVDAAWSGIFSTAENIIVIPEDNGGNKGLNGEDADASDPVMPDDNGDPQNSDQPDADDSKKDDNSKKQDNTSKDTKKADDSKKQDNAKMKASEVLDSLKKSLGSSYTSDNAETESRMSGYYGLDMSKIESWVAENNSSSSLNMDCAVVLQVKDGYAQDAAALLQTSFEQVCSYARMYNMDLQRVLQARLFVNGNYVALLIEGQKSDPQASEEDQAKFAADEAAKVDAAWSGIFGTAANTIVIPASNGGNSGFNMNDMPEDVGDGALIGG